MPNTLSKISRLGWTQEEQELLLRLYELQSIKDWNTIANKINELAPGKSRTSKQCRQRFSNYVRSNGQPVKKAQWEEQQEKILFQKYLELGSKWIQISKFLPGRPENCIKNRFYGSLRKIVRSLNKIAQTKFKKKAKIIRYETLLNILQQECQQVQGNALLCEETSFKNFVEKLKISVVQLATSHELQIEEEKALQLMDRIHTFSLVLRPVLLSKIRSKNSKSKSLHKIKNELKLGKIERNNKQINEKEQQQFLNSNEQKTIQQYQKSQQQKKNQIESQQSQEVCLFTELFPKRKPQEYSLLTQFFNSQDQKDLLIDLGWI